MKKERDSLAQSNENLRLQVGKMQEKADPKLMRELEILARAEKEMVVKAPGFAGAWEMAKESALEEITAEEAGKSLPKRIFRKFFGSGGAMGREEPADALPERQEMIGDRDSEESDSPAEEVSPAEVKFPEPWI